MPLLQGQPEEYVVWLTRSIHRTLGNAHNRNMILEEMDMARPDGTGDALQG